MKLSDIISSGSKTEAEYQCHIAATRAALANGSLAIGDYEIIVHSGPDVNGNHAFTALWIDESSRRPRGQVFRSNLAEHRAYWEQRKTRLS